MYWKSYIVLAYAKEVTYLSLCVFLSLRGGYRRRRKMRGIHPTSVYKCSRPTDFSVYSESSCENCKHKLTAKCLAFGGGITGERESFFSELPLLWVCSSLKTSLIPHR